MFPQLLGHDPAQDAHTAYDQQISAAFHCHGDGAANSKSHHLQASPPFEQPAVTADQ